MGQDEGGPLLVAGMLLLGAEALPPLELEGAERSRLDGIRAPGRALQYRAGRWLLRRLCALAGGPGPEGLTLSAQGPPRVLGGGPPPAPFLTLAHSGSWVVGAACARACGVDLERRGAGRDWAALAVHLGLPSAGEEDVLAAWTQKEARYKADGAPGLVLRRFEGPGYLGCLAAPPGAQVTWVCFGGAATPSWTLKGQE